MVIAMLQCVRNSLKHKSAPPPPPPLSLSFSISLSLSVAIVPFLVLSMFSISCNYHTPALFLCSRSNVHMIALSIHNFSVGGSQRSGSRLSVYPLLPYVTTLKYDQVLLYVTYLCVSSGTVTAALHSRIATQESECT